MAYRIVYGEPDFPHGKTNGGKLRFRVLTAIFLLVFTLLVQRKWPEGRRKLGEYLLPGQTSQQEAVDAFAEDLRAGASLEEALTAFCRDVIENGRKG